MSKKKEVIKYTKPIILFSSRALQATTWLEPGQQGTLESHFTPYQNISQSNRDSGIQFLNFIEKLMKKHDCMWKFVPGALPTADCSFFSALIMGKVDRQLQPDGAMTLSGSVFQTPHFFMAVYLLNHVHDRMFKPLTSGLSKRTRDKLFNQVRKINAIRRTILRKTHAPWATFRIAQNLTYWHCEYKKRFFLQSILTDNAALEQARRVFKELRSECQGMINTTRACIPNCPWREPLPNGTKGLPIIHCGPPCISHNCRFSRALLSSMTNALDAESIYETSELFARIYPPEETQDRITNTDLIANCISLLEKYSVYPLDLFSYPSPREILQHKQEEGTFPSPMAFPIAPKNSTHTRTEETIATNIKEIREETKPLYVGKSYRELDEERLIGLWVWDQINLVKQGDNQLFQETIDDLLQQEWLKQTVKGQEILSAKDNCADCLKERVDRIREWYRLTQECITKKTVLPLSSVIKRKKKRS